MLRNILQFKSNLSVIKLLPLNLLSIMFKKAMYFFVIKIYICHLGHYNELINTVFISLGATVEHTVIFFLLDSP